MAKAKYKSVNNKRVRMSEKEVKARASHENKPSKRDKKSYSIETAIIITPEILKEFKKLDPSPIKDFLGKLLGTHK